MTKDEAIKVLPDMKGAGDDWDKAIDLAVEALKHNVHDFQKDADCIRCKDCKWWHQQTAYNGARLSFGFCESDNMWDSLYGETTEISHIDTDDDFFCRYAERRTDERSE